MNLFHAQKILEVGSGTGAVIEEIMSLTTNPELYALDINWIALQSNLCTNKILGKGEQLPFPDNFFDITLCHYLLLWIKNPIDVLKEIGESTKEELMKLQEGLGLNDLAALVSNLEEFEKLSGEI